MHIWQKKYINSFRYLMLTREAVIVFPVLVTEYCEIGMEQTDELSISRFSLKQRYLIIDEACRNSTWIAWSFRKNNIIFKLNDTLICLHLYKSYNYWTLKWTLFSYLRVSTNVSPHFWSDYQWATHSDVSDTDVVKLVNGIYNNFKWHSSFLE